MWPSLKFKSSEETPKSTQFKLENSRFFFFHEENIARNETITIPENQGFIMEILPASQLQRPWQMLLKYKLSQVPIGPHARILIRIFTLCFIGGRFALCCGGGGC